MHVNAAAKMTCSLFDDLNPAKFGSEMKIICQSPFLFLKYYELRYNYSALFKSSIDTDRFDTRYLLPKILGYLDHPKNLGK